MGKEGGLDLWVDGEGGKIEGLDLGLFVGGAVRWGSVIFFAAMVELVKRGEIFLTVKNCGKLVNTF